MATSFSDNIAGSRGPAWASAIGVIAIVLGVFLTATQGNEWMKQYVMVDSMPASKPAADCPEEELEEEGISLAECEYLVDHVWGLGLSTPDWFPGTQMLLAGTGMILAFLSIVIGGALVNYKPWAATAAVLIFGALLLVDLLQFAAVVNAGPVVREVYLWDIVLWFFIHLLLITGLIAARHTEASL